MYAMLSDYCRTFDDKLNLPLINRELDKDTYIYVYETIKSLEVFDSVKILGYKFKDKENDIRMSEYVRTRVKDGRKEAEEPVQIMNIPESRLGELTIYYELSIDVKQEDGTYKMERKEYTKNILIPLKDDDGCFTLKGKRYMLMYQLVDSTTYTTSNSVVFKSIMAIPLKRKVKYISDVDKYQYTVPLYTTTVFKNEINMLSLFFAKMGLENTLKYFSVDRIISFTDSVGEDLDRYQYFRISQKLHIRVHRTIFENSLEVKSLICMMMDIMTNRTLITQIFDRNFWLEKLGTQQNIQQSAFRRAKAENLLVSVDRMMDVSTRRVVNLSPDHKDSMYSALRWMFMNYNELKSKQIMDVTNKRLRDNEYIASLMTNDLSQSLYRVMNKVKKPQCRNLSTLEELFAFRGDILINNLFDSGLFKYDDIVNDMDFWNKLKYTINKIVAYRSNSIWKSSLIAGKSKFLIGI